MKELLILQTHYKGNSYHESVFIELIDGDYRVNSLEFDVDDFQDVFYITDVLETVAEYVKQGYSIRIQKVEMGGYSH